MANRFVFLTFDVEEFDMPLEYGQNISAAEQMQIGFDGLEAITPLLNQSFVQTTLFTTANFAQHYPNTIKQLSTKHEIASHTFYHSSFKTEDLVESRKVLQNISQQNVNGLRMPRLKKIPIEDVENAGYTYDSSINPTYLPGRYNSLDKPKIIYKNGIVTIVPTAVTPNLRIPLFWLAFKNLPLAIYKNLALQTLKKYGYLSLYFHPWEFTNIADYALPTYTKKPCGNKLLHKLNKLIAAFKTEAEFVRIDEYLRKSNYYNS